MEHELLYKKIERLAIVLTLIVSGAVAFITKNPLDTSGVLLGGISSLFGFLWIKKSSETIILSGNASKLAVANYIMRYIIYGIIFYLGMRVGMNGIFMLIGFSMVSISIKIIILKDKTEV